MAANWVVPGTNNFVIGTDRDLMNITDWQIFIVDLSTNAVSDETSNVKIAEIIQPISNPASGTLASDIPAGSRVIPLESGDGANFKVEMKITIKTSVGDEYREIREVSGDSLVLWKPLEGSVKADSNGDGTNDVKVIQIGNTGDYNVTVDSTALAQPLVPNKSYQIECKSDKSLLDTNSDIFHTISYGTENLKDDMEFMRKSIESILNENLGTAKIYI